MSDAINDGGPAFPFDERNGDGTHYSSHAGMTLRDYFAAKVLAAMVARPGSVNPSLDAEFAYVLADAMLNARQA